MKRSAESFFIADPISFIARGTTFYCKSALLYCARVGAILHGQRKMIFENRASPRRLRSLRGISPGVETWTRTLVLTSAAGGRLSTH